MPRQVMPGSGVFCCLTVPSSLEDALHSHKMCGEDSVRKWVQRSCQAGRRVTPAQKQWEMLRFKLHNTSGEPGQASCSLLYSAFSQECGESASWSTMLKERGLSGIKITALIRTRKDCHLACYKLDESFSWHWFKWFIFWFIWSGTCVLTEEHLKDVCGLS